jgi:gliding motility-associated lipoprotein GldD
MLKNNHFIILSLALMVLLYSCDGNKTFIPKPPTYLKIEFPERNYSVYKDECNFSFEAPSYFEIQNIKNSCNRDIYFKDLNGTLHLSYINMDTTLSAYVNYTLDKIDEHKVKATAIYDSVFINNETKVYGTFFELQGNVASPFQFYLTDSTKIFMNGIIYFNTRPNYDSIKPVLNFVREDLYKIMKTTQWSK